MDNTKRLVIMLSEQDYKRISKKAESLNMAAHEYIRKVATGKLQKDDVYFLSRLAKDQYGNNINLSDKFASDINLSIYIQKGKKKMTNKQHS